MGLWSSHNEAVQFESNIPAVTVNPSKDLLRLLNNGVSGRDQLPLADESHERLMQGLVFKLFLFAQPPPCEAAHSFPAMNPIYY